MRKNTFLFFILTLFFSGVLLAQEVSFWKEETKKAVLVNKLKNYPTATKVFNLSLSKFKKTLQKQSDVIMRFPDANGKLVAYNIEEASIMHPDLEAKYPNNKSYRGVAVNDASNSIRFSVNDLGVYAAIYKVGVGTVYIDPISQNGREYAVFNREDLKKHNSFECLVQQQVHEHRNLKSKFNVSSDLKLRTYELALATTGEYSLFHVNSAGVAGGTEAQKKQAVMNAVVAVMTRVNAIFERDVAVTMTLVANTDQLFFLDASTDPYTNDDGSTMLNENQTTIDNIIGVNNYDIGHVFSTGGGGIASLASPCSGSKARGVTGQPNPIGDPFSVDYVAHEMGHQFGANHTFNGTEGSCSGNRNDATAVEPGSGSTIMSYAGICSPQNVQPLVNDYFHTVSIQEMRAFVTSNDSNCDDETTLVNNLHIPLVNAGADFVVPKSTPLVLKGQASDADGNSLTYCWEQIDNGIVNITSPPNATQTRGALFRSLSPTSSPDRYLPALNTVLSGYLASKWQVLPSVGRTMNFALTVRDNATGGGQVAIDEMKVTVDGNSGPFVVTSQNENEVFWAAGTQETILWDVANTNVAPVNCQNVNIVLSLDGGLTYPVTLASNVPNDGSHQVTVPNNLTTTGRVKVEGVNTIFYSVNRTNISIANDFALSITDKSKKVCAPNSVTYDLNLNFASGFSETVTLSANNLPSGATVSFNPATVNSTSNVQMTISGTSDIDVGEYDIEALGTSISKTRKSQVQLQVFKSEINVVSLSLPTNQAVGVLAKGTTLTWSADENVEGYDVQIATDATFNTLVESVSVLQNSFSPTNLEDVTTYYWRVRPKNVCVIANFSEVYLFTTSEIVCKTYTYSGVDVSIPDENTTGVNVNLNVSDDVIINDVNVNLNIDHSWMRDLIIKLKSPASKEIELLNRQCRGNAGNKNMVATFDDSGLDLECANSSPVITGIVKPTEPLSEFKNESSVGNWTLNISDNGKDDIGVLKNFSVEICESRAVALEQDEEFSYLKMWPNPTNDKVSISFVTLRQEPVQIIVYDILGRVLLVKKQQVKSLLFNDEISLKQFSSGMYFFKITQGNSSVVKRVLAN